MSHPYTGEIKPCPFCGNQPGHYNLHDSLYPTGEWVKSPFLDIRDFGEDLGIIYYYQHPLQILLESQITERGYVWSFSCLESEFGCGCELTGNSIDEVMNKWNRRV
jgi:hypothetical protein